MVLVLVPISFSTVVYNMYSSPKFALLLTLSSALVALLSLTVVRRDKGPSEIWRVLTSKHVILVSLYIIVISISAVFGVSPNAMVFGSSYNRMGLVTYFCFFAIFLSVIAHTSTSSRRFRQMLWAMTLTGLLVGTYAFLQFFRRDPFIQSRSYTFDSAAGELIRVTSTLGHSNYLGNFLLYVTPLAFGVALTSRGQARRIAILSGALSAAAILFTGTRGAWLGLTVGVLLFLVMGRSGKLFQSNRRQLKRAIGIAALLLGIASTVVVLNPASRTIIQRARSFVQDTTGSGRTLLWRDSLKMLRHFTIIGCGPEGFRKAFLAYKSADLSRFAPNVNNESSHNSYLDAGISFGLPGLILYIAIIASSFALLFRTYRDMTDRFAKITVLSLFSSLAAVVMHNFFIFDQISTGLYFFAFVALAQSAFYHLRGTRLLDDYHAPIDNAAAPNTGRTHSVSNKKSLSRKQILQLPQSSLGLTLKLTFLFISFILFCGSVWFSIGIVRADNEITKAISSAVVGNLDGVLEHGNRAVSHPDPSGDYHFLFARSLTLFADTSVVNRSDESKSGSLGSDLNTAANRATTEAKASLPHTLTPDSSYLLLAYLAGHLRQTEMMLTYAAEAIKCDPNSSNTHWMMAEAHLAEENLEAAKQEATLSLELDPRSTQARETLKKTRNKSDVMEIVQQSIRDSNELMNAGKFQDAKGKLLRALRLSEGKCPDCHKALGALYEAEHLYQDAISELQLYAGESPAEAMADGTSSRIERLKKAAATAQR